MDEFNQKVEQVSRYNEAGMQIMRLHQLWLIAESYANKGRLIKWKFILDSIWRELYADVKRKDDSKKIIEENNELKTKIAEAKKNLLYLALDKRHEFLKGVQDDVGKGAIYMDPDSDDFD